MTDGYSMCWDYKEYQVLQENSKGTFKFISISLRPPHLVFSFLPHYIKDVLHIDMNSFVN